jgi:hypothetical protein
MAAGATSWAGRAESVLDRTCEVSTSPRLDTTLLS